MRWIIIFLALRVGAATYYVDSGAGSDSNNGTSSGTPWKTLVHSQTNIVANDTVLLNRGAIWYESWTNLVNGVTVDAYGAGAAPILDGGYTNRWVFLSITASNTFCRHLYLRNGGTNNASNTGALWETDALTGTNTITDCTLNYHTIDDAVAVDNGWGIISNCVIINAADQGVTIHNNGNAVVSQCVISNCLEAFKNSTSSGQLAANDCTMINNVLSDVDSLTATTAVFNRCWFKGQASGATCPFFKACTTNVTFNYCLFDASKGSGLTSTGIYPVGPSPVVFNNCTFYGNGKGDMYLSGATTSMYMTNCILSSWWRSANLNSGTFVMDHCLFNNITVSNATLVVSQVSTSSPLFTNPSAGDFTLQAGSPAIQTGINLGYTIDLAGNVVLNPPSLGVYEFGSGPPAANLFKATYLRVGQIIKSP